MTTSKDVESFKQEKAFDKGLVDVLIPVNHVFRTKAAYRDQVEVNVSRGINPEFIQFILDGCAEVPHRVQVKKPVRVGNKFTSRPQLRVYLRNFLQIYYRQQGQPLETTKLQRAARLADQLIVELIRRSELANLFD